MARDWFFGKLCAVVFEIEPREEAKTVTSRPDPVGADNLLDHRILPTLAKRKNRMKLRWTHWHGCQAPPPLENAASGQAAPFC